MRFKISDNERELIRRFKNEKYPSIYKTDKTDNILFVELVDFDVCSALLKGRSIDDKQYKYVMEEYQRFLEQIDIDAFDESALAHYKDILQIMEIFKKYCF